MIKEVADKWVEALRSGKYEQETGVLCFEDRYCCLGVLCDILQIKKEENCYDGEYEILPNSAIKASGMKSDMGILKYQGKDTSLADINDNGASFEIIAKIIEDNWEQL